MSHSDPRRRPAVEACQSGLFPTAGYWLKRGAFYLASFCSERAKIKHARLCGAPTPAAGATLMGTTDAPLQKLADAIARESPKSTRSRQDIEKQQSIALWAERGTIALAFLGSAIPIVQTIGAQAQAFTSDETRSAAVADQTNAAFVYTVLASSEIAIPIKSLIETLLRNYRGTYNHFSRGKWKVILLKLGTGYLACNAAATTALIMYQSTLCAEDQTDQTLSTTLNIWATGIAGLLYLPDITAIPWRRIDRADRGPIEHALYKQLQALYKSTKTVQQHANTEDLNNLLTILPTTHLALIQFLQKDPKRQILAVRTVPARILRGFVGWVIQPIAAASIITLTLAQTPLVLRAQNDLPWHGYGVLLPSAGLSKIPAAGFIAAFGFNFAFPYFGRMRMVAGAKEMLFRLLGLIRTRYWSLRFGTGFALLLSGASAYLSASVPEEQTACGIDAASHANMTGQAVRRFDHFVASGSFVAVSDPAAIADGFTVNFTTVFLLTAFVVGTLLLLPTWVSQCLNCCQCCRSRSLERLDNERHAADKAVSRRIIEIESMGEDALAIARKLDRTAGKTAAPGQSAGDGGHDTRDVAYQNPLTVAVVEPGQ